MNKSTLALLPQGPDTIFSLTRLFYTKVFDDPVLNVLFQHKDVNEHGNRFAWFILQKCKVSNKYSLERGRACGKCASSNSAKYTPLMEAHERAKSCPLRDHTKRKISKRAGVYGGQFTVSQKNNWLNHFENACKDLKLDAKFQKVFLSWLKISMPKYGPFATDRVEKVKRRKLAKTRNTSKNIARARLPSTKKLESKGSEPCNIS